MTTRAAQLAAESEIDEMIRAALRRLLYRHPDWPAEVREDIKKECEGELYLVEEVAGYGELVRVVAEANSPIESPRKDAR